MHCVSMTMHTLGRVRLGWVVGHLECPYPGPAAVGTDYETIRAKLKREGSIGTLCPPLPASEALPIALVDRQAGSFLHSD